jgi:CHAT domain-containing protein
MVALRDALLPWIQEFVTKPACSSSREVLEQHPELLCDAAVELARALQEHATEPGAGARIGERRALLERCLQVGVAHAYDECALQRYSAGLSHLRGFERTSNRTALDEAVALMGEAASLVSPEPVVRSSVLTSLGYALLSRFQLGRAAPDLAQAIETLDEAVRLCPPDATRRDLCLANLALALLERHAEQHDPQDREQGIGLLAEAVRAAPSGSPHAAARFAALGHAFLGRYRDRDRGERDDLETAIRACDRAAALFQGRLPFVHRPPLTDWVPLARDLAGALLLRYELLGELGDVERGIDVAEKALDAATRLPAGPVPDGCPTGELKAIIEGLRPDPPLMSTLGALLTVRYDRLGGDPIVLTRSIGQVLLALPALGDDDATCRSLIVLGLAHRLRFHTSARDEADLDRSIEFLEEAVRSSKARAHVSPALAARCAGELWHSLRDRSLATGRTEDLERAVERLEQGLRLIPPGTEDGARVAADLARALQLRHERSGADEDAASAAAAYLRAADAGLGCSHIIALSVAGDWFRWAFGRGDWAAAAQAYEYVSTAERDLVDRQLLREEKASWLRETQGLASRAGYALARLGRIRDAAFTIEEGLGRLWTASHELSAPALEQLATVPPELVGRYLDAVRLVQQQSTDVMFENQLSPMGKAGGYDPIHGWAANARSRLKAAITDIRRQPGCSDFLRPRSTEQLAANLQAATAQAPAAYLVATEHGGMALLVRNGDAPMPPVRLPELSSGRVREKLGTADGTAARGYLGAYAAWRERPGGKAQQERWFAALDALAGWLWDAAMRPLLNALGGVPELTLVPIGALWLLPFHAAWCKDDASPLSRSYALDRTRIRYAPSLRVHAASLARARVQGSRSALVVEEPQPVGLARLPDAGLEAEVARFALAPDSRIVRRKRATRDEVVKGLRECAVAHFACHGSSDPASPLDGHLVMARDEPLTLRELLLERLAPRRLAILSACDTALPGSDLPDEAMSLAAGMLMAGFAGVIASSWSLGDESATLLMARFYVAWRHEQCHPAEALRRAQQWLRNETNHEKAEYFRAFVPGFADDDARVGLLPATVAQTLYARMSTRPPDERGHAAPVFWGAFTYLGA